MQNAVDAFGGLDILVSNAGYAPQGAMVDIDEALLRDSFELNFFAHFRMARPRMPFLPDGPRGPDPVQYQAGGQSRQELRPYGCPGGADVPASPTSPNSATGRASA